VAAGKVQVEGGGIAIKKHAGHGGSGLGFELPDEISSAPSGAKRKFFQNPRHLAGKIPYVLSDARHSARHLMATFESQQP
jgi:hypothetical protein